MEGGGAFEWFLLFYTGGDFCLLFSLKATYFGLWKPGNAVELWLALSSGRVQLNLNLKGDPSAYVIRSRLRKLSGWEFTGKLSIE